MLSWKWDQPQKLSVLNTDVCEIGHSDFDSWNGSPGVKVSWIESFRGSSAMSRGEIYRVSIRASKLISTVTVRHPDEALRWCVFEEVLQKRAGTQDALWNERHHERVCELPRCGKEVRSVRFTPCTILQEDVHTIVDSLDSSRMLLLWRMNVVLLLLILGTSGQEREAKGLLVASSSFWLKLSPTPQPLDSESIQVLQSSVNRALRNHLAMTPHSTLSSQIDSLSFHAQMDRYEIQNIDAIFRAVIFGNVTNAYTCIAIFALASVRTNHSEDAAEYLVDRIQNHIDTDLVQWLGSSAFLGQILTDTNGSTDIISNDAIRQLYSIESISIFPMTKAAASSFNGSQPPLPDMDWNQNELLPGDIALITVSLLVLFLLIVPLIVRSNASPICRDSDRHESSPSMEYLASATPMADLPNHPNDEKIPYDNELGEAFASPNDVSNIIVTSPSILAGTSHDSAWAEDLENPSKSAEEFGHTDIMESLDAPTSLRFATPSLSSSDEEEAGHSASSSEDNMILALLSTASKTSPSSSIASFQQLDEDFGSLPHRRGMHEEMNAPLYASSLGSTKGNVS
jgi:hypothetical protein